MIRRKDLDVDKRMEAVLSLLRREEPGRVIARRHGISEATLYRLREQFLDGGKTALSLCNGRSNKQSQKVSRLEREVAERDRVIGELTIANRILKKTREGLL